MKTLLKIAWRNIWRVKLRSLVVITSIVLGIWAGVSVSGFSYGLNKQRTNSTIRENVSHIQIHNPAWEEEEKLSNWVADEGRVQEYLSESKDLESHSWRIKMNGMLASAHFTSGIQIIGIEPEREGQLTELATKIDSGEYLGESGRNPILIGNAMAEKLQVKPGSKVVLTFTNEDGDIISAAFKVKGFFDALSTQQEKSQVYVRNSDLLALLGRESGAHEFAMYLSNPEQLDQIEAELKAKFPDLLIQNWKEISPELGYADELMSTMLYIIMGIIMLALCFGIINNMLMAVLERRKELGMLMGVGMSKTRLFFMIMFETVMLSMVGGPIGIFLGFLTIQITKKTGLNLSFYSKGLENIGIDTIIYPAVENNFYFGTGLLVVGVTLIAAVWPARRALKLNPVEAIRTI